MGSRWEFSLLSVNKEQAQKGLRCLGKKKKSGFPATEQEREKHKAKYLVSGNLFLYEIAPETSVLVTLV